MNLGPSQAETLVRRLDMHIPNQPETNIVLCPNFTQLSEIKNLIVSMGAEKKFNLGAQNVNEHDEGAYTGETSPSMLKALVKYVIVGHSERRRYFGETDEQVALKAAACLRHGIRPIVCIGENLQQRKDNLAKRTVLDQLEVALSELTKQELEKIIIAYEPVWAIGTGEFAKPDQVEEILQAITGLLRNKYGEQTLAKIPVIYGGSVDAQNARSYVSLPGMHGLLVGGASLNYKAFSAICQA